MALGRAVAADQSTHPPPRQRWKGRTIRVARKSDFLPFLPLWSSWVLVGLTRVDQPCFTHFFVSLTCVMNHHIYLNLPDEPFSTLQSTVLNQLWLALIKVRFGAKIRTASDFLEVNRRACMAVPASPIGSPRIERTMMTTVKVQPARGTSMSGPSLPDTLAWLAKKNQWAPWSSPWPVPWLRRAWSCFVHFSFF